MYAITKFSAEMLVSQYSDYFETIIARFFGVYGPGQKSMIIPSMIDAVSTGKEITLAGGIGLFLNPIYISDCIEILNQLVISRNIFKNEIFNISGSKTTTLFEIVQKIEKLLGKKANIRITTDRPIFLIGSNNKIMSHTKIKTLVPIESGLKLVVGDGK